MAKSKTLNYQAKGQAGLLVSVNFEPLIEQIKKAEGDVEAATFKAARVGAKVMYDELVAECRKSNVPEDIISGIAFQAERDGNGNRIGVKVGWRMPQSVDYNNLSTGQKAALLNYGTASRHTESGENRGWVDAKNFIRRAKRKARPKIKDAQEQALKEILDNLRG